MEQRLRQELSRIVAHPVQWDCSLAEYTSFGIGGPAEALVTVDRREELAALLGFLEASRIPWRVIGKGTNLLVRDEGFAGAVLLLGRDFKQVDLVPGGGGLWRARVGAGCSLARLVSLCGVKGLAGLEFAVGIPGTVGGAAVMNAGAWGSDMAAVIRAVTMIDQAGEEVLGREDLHFGYRCWQDFRRFAGRAVVAGCELELAEDDPQEVRRRCTVFQQKRQGGQPRGQGNAGSFFRNPANDSAGRLIEASGLKGMTVGGAMVSEKHANFLVNAGGATAADVLALMRLVQDKVRQDSGVELEPEVHVL
ncbi:MAG: UDP-N-acetylmuramate dehydrogenase [Desulfobulbaceae bacterium]|nr:MAG: UDP-N-acetylmuramate dehydrogenase [Desulfobulbaceae bacterium]